MISIKNKAAFLEEKNNTSYTTKEGHRKNKSNILESNLYL